MTLEKKPLCATRQSTIVRPLDSRVITREHFPDSITRIKDIVNSVLNLPENDVIKIYKNIMEEFSGRHKRLKEVFEKHYNHIEYFIQQKDSLSTERRLLLGAYFTKEYSVESAALFNPSIVLHPDQNGLNDNEARFIMSFRATGEGHISSIEFRSGIIDKNNNIVMDSVSNFVETPEIHPYPIYNKLLFQLKLSEMDASDEVTQYILNQLPEEFTFALLQEKINQLSEVHLFSAIKQNEGVEMMQWLAKSNYTVIFHPDRRISERVIFPVAENESRGIEDARFVRFTDDDGEVTYYATYTAYDGFKFLPQMLATKDFFTFKMTTLNGKAVQNKGMALFPRRINGKYVMLSRQDGVNNHIMFSDNIHFWQESKIIQTPANPWEFMQIGNCGSPIETEAGWIMLTHGVGPMKKYCIGVALLDLKDPTKIICRIDEPIIAPNEDERDGYVPNVVYSCGSLIHNDELIIPYAMADSKSSIATISVTKLFKSCGLRL
ncbi:MAG: glycoside hydrolase family 130 protein [Candidatus Anammoxibacter sp.]